MQFISFDIKKVMDGTILSSLMHVWHHTLLVMGINKYKLCTKFEAAMLYITLQKSKKLYSRSILSHIALNEHKDID